MSGPYVSDTPATGIVNSGQALETLSYAEMSALSGLFKRWAQEETGLSDDQRSKLAKLSSDYAIVANHAGLHWTPSAPGSKVDAMQFVARLELADRAALATVKHDP